MERKEPTFSGVQTDHGEQPAAAKPTVSRKPPQKAREVPVTPAAVPPQTGSSSMATFALLFSLLGLGLAAYLFWVLLETQQQLSDANSRILELQQTLVLSGDESTQSLSTLQANLRKQQGDMAALGKNLEASRHEIRKLWDTRNVNKKAIAVNSKGLKQQAGKTQSLPGNVKTLQSQVAAQDKLLSSVKTDARQALETATLLSGALDQQQQNLRELTDAGIQIERATAELTGRLKSSEEAIRSIDAFRKNTNSELWKLKQALKPAPVKTP